MKNVAPLLLLVGLSQLALTQAFSTFIVNGDFENGLAGWTKHAEGGSFYNPEKPDLAYPYPNPISLGYKPLDGYINYFNTPPSTLTGGGDQMLKLGDFQGASESLTAPDGTRWEVGFLFMRVSIYQDLNLTAGQTVSGWSRFITEEYDYEYHDSDDAMVTIDDIEIWEKSPLDVVPGNLIISDNFFNILPTDWEQWSWTAPTDGTYRLSLSSYMDDQEESYGYFDNITVSSPITRVDDSFSTIALLSSAMGLLLFIRKNPEKHNTVSNPS